MGRAMSEKLWNGTYLELAEAHQEFLCLWHKQPPMQIGSARKVWATAFPSLDKASCSAILKKIAGIKTFCLKKKRNSRTGEYMDPAVKVILQSLVSSELLVKDKSSSDLVNHLTALRIVLRSGPEPESRKLGLAHRVDSTGALHELLHLLRWQCLRMKIASQENDFPHIEGYGTFLDFGR